MMAIQRVDPPLTGSEVDLLRAFLDFHRATLRLKADGLDGPQLAQALPPSSLTLGGLLKHMALVETGWFENVLEGRKGDPAWVPEGAFDDDEDWEFHSAAEDAPDDLRRWHAEAVAGADAAIDRALAKEGLDTLSTLTRRKEPGQYFSLRRILLHMIEEYARHNGHADLLREAIDGQVGE
jgi:uncharacterized damage-inducible protein DinB